MANPEETPSPKRRRGGQPGNRNAHKAGHHTAAMRQMRQRIWAWRLENRRVLALARCELRLRAALAQMDRDREAPGLRLVRDESRLRLTGE